MYDVEFLPPWYPEVQHRGRVLRFQIAVAVIVSAAMVIVTIGESARAAADHNRAAQCQDLVNQSIRDVNQLEAKKSQRQLRQRQEHLVAELGLNLGAPKMIQLVNSALGPDVALTELSLSNPAPTTRSEAGSFLQMNIRGVAASDIEVASVINRLNQFPFIQKLTMDYTKPQVMGNHTLRQFDLQFATGADSLESAVAP